MLVTSSKSTSLKWVVADFLGPMSLTPEAASGNLSVGTLLTDARPDATARLGHTRRELSSVKLLGCPSALLLRCLAYALRLAIGKSGIGKS